MQYTVGQVERAIHDSRLEFYAEQASKEADIAGLAGIANVALGRRIDDTLPMGFLFDLASRFCLDMNGRDMNVVGYKSKAIGG